MRSIAMLIVGVVALFGVGCGKNDKDAIQGTWSLVSMEAGGNAAPADQIKDEQIIITADKFTPVHGGTQEKDGESYKIDPGAKPKAIDVTATRKSRAFGKAEENVEIKTMKGIYTLEGDTLKFCFNEPDKDRPSDFASKGGQIFFTLQRAK